MKEHGRRILSALFRRRRWIVVGLQLCLITLSNYFSFWLRFDGAIPAEEWALYLQTIPFLLAVRGLLFIPFRLYEGLWRYTSIWDLRNILAGVLSSTTLFYVLIHWVLGLTGYPRSVFVVDSVLLIFLLTGIRLTRRISKEFVRLEEGKRVLIFGAGDAGEMIVRDMRNNTFYNYQPIGFIDDDPLKVGERIHGVLVLGATRDLPRIMETENPHEVIVAISRVEPQIIRNVVKALEPFKVPIKLLPNLRDVLNGKVTMSQIRNLAVEDLLTREPVGLDPNQIRNLVAGRTVLITGAGGSIGSELARQILKLQPGLVVLFERHEHSLYTLQNEILDGGYESEFTAIVGDITDVNQVNKVMTQYSPDIVFHAAAYKHVPMMENHPCEAIKNNIGGTRILAEAACSYDVKKFILISTDKAVNPANVMGATKHVAERLVNAMHWASKGTQFATVRFGNVLASNGSVVPRFLEQIKAGGPVTVTHPEIERYFMLIPEAVQLVLHAAALAEPGSVYVLKMGEQIKIAEMARNLIRLSGFVPEVDIEITFTGLRPGEKLFEELSGDDEVLAEVVACSKILQVRSLSRPHDHIREKVQELEEFAAKGDQAAASNGLFALVRRSQTAGQSSHKVASN